MNRTPLLLVFAMLPLAASVTLAQQRPDPPRIDDRRPFGKFLARVCELGRGCYDPSTACDPACTSKVGCNFCQHKDAQSIELKHVGCPSGILCGNPKYPLAVGDTFYIEAKAKTDVSLSVELGHATPGPWKPGDAVHAFVVTGRGPIRIKATADAKNDSHFLPAAPATIELQTADDPSPDCYGLYDKAQVSTAKPDVARIATLAGNPTPYTLAVEGDRILVYASRWPPKPPEETALLDRLVAMLEGPLGSNAEKAFGVKPATLPPAPFDDRVFTIAHAAALGDPAKRINDLGYKAFTTQNVGSTPGKVRISAAKAPSCDDWKAFLSAVRDLEWGPKSVTPVTKLSYLSADDAVKSLKAAFGDGSSSSGGGGSSATASTPAAGGSGGGGGAAAASPANASISVNQPPGSKLEIRTDTTPCIEAGLAFGNSGACAPAAAPAAGGAGAGGGPGASSGANPIGPAKSPTVAAIGLPPSTPPAGTLPAPPTDMLLFGSPTPGDDEQISERNRILALLDLPHPEMIVNAWQMQRSTADPHAIGEFSRTVRATVDRYNDSLEQMVLNAYEFVSRQMLHPNYFNDPFYHYISDRYVAEEKEESKHTAQDFLTGSPARLSREGDRERDLGVCAKDHYCLGYSWLFKPAKPRLTDLLLGLIAARDPLDRAIETINWVQGTAPACCCADPDKPATCALRTSQAAQDAKAKSSRKKKASADAVEQLAEAGAQTSTSTDARPFQSPEQLMEAPAKALRPLRTVPLCPDCPPSVDSRADFQAFDCAGLPAGDTRNRCVTVKDRLALQTVTNYLDPRANCSIADQWGILISQFVGAKNDDTGREWTPRPPRPHLACFARAAATYLSENAGLARAAVADFLFQYKRSQQYPHDFSAYALNHAAANLNSALGPLIDAFNRDVVAFQAYMRTDIEFEVEANGRRNDARCCVKRLFGIDKPSFFNDGIVSVRTISGQSAQVNATSQSFLDASQAPTIAELANAMGGAATLSSASPLAAVLGGVGTQAPVSLLNSVLGLYQKTYARIGRQLQLQVVPRSLATASAAEITVFMKGADAATPPTFSGGPPSAANQNASEVSNHDVTTRIRVDSVKLFELTSYSAVLQRSRSKFPLLPPFVELPYIGTIAGIPLSGAKEYHESTAVISAMVVPTAADIGYGLRFLDDLVILGPEGATCTLTGDPEPRCRVRRALAWSDLRESVASYNDALTLCFATETASGRPGPEFATWSTGKGYYEFRNGVPIHEAPKTGERVPGSPQWGSCREVTLKGVPDYQ